MEINVVKNFDQLDNIKSDWNDSYQTDQIASYFMSWPWIRGWCEVANYDWLILAARKDSSSPYIAFMPLGIKTYKINRLISKINLYTGGIPWADHSGIICNPENIEEALQSFAYFIKKMTWDTFILNEIFDSRMIFFLKCFSNTTKYLKQYLDATPCPFIQLPETWKQYCSESIGKKAKKKIQYYFRRINRKIDYRITRVNKNNLMESIEILIKLYKIRRNPTSEILTERYRIMYPRCFENDSLWLNILWDGEVPVAALSGFFDKKNETFLFYNTGFDEKYSKLSPGIVIIAESIRYAIKKGCKIFDFGRGAENYKYELGAKDRYNTNTEISKNSFFSSAKKTLIKVNGIGKRLLSQ